MKSILVVALMGLVGLSNCLPEALLRPDLPELTRVKRGHQTTPKIAEEVKAPLPTESNTIPNKPAPALESSVDGAATSVISPATNEIPTTQAPSTTTSVFQGAVDPASVSTVAPAQDAAPPQANEPTPTAETPKTADEKFVKEIVLEDRIIISPEEAAAEAADERAALCLQMTCTPPPRDMDCKTKYDDGSVPKIPGLDNDCCPIYVCQREDGFKKLYYGIEVPETPDPSVIGHIMEGSASFEDPSEHSFNMEQQSSQSQSIENINPFFPDFPLFPQMFFGGAISEFAPQQENKMSWREFQSRNNNAASSSKYPSPNPIEMIIPAPQSKDTQPRSPFVSKPTGSQSSFKPSTESSYVNQLVGMLHGMEPEPSQMTPPQSAKSNRLMELKRKYAPLGGLSRLSPADRPYRLSSRMNSLSNEGTPRPRRSVGSGFDMMESAYNQQDNMFEDYAFGPY